MTTCTLPPQEKKSRRRKILNRPRVLVGVAALLGLVAIQTALIWRYAQKSKPQEQARSLPSVITETKNEVPSIVSRMSQSQEKVPTATIADGIIDKASMPALAEISTYKTLVSSKDSNFVANEDDEEAEPIRALAPVSTVMDWPPRITAPMAEIDSGKIAKVPAKSSIASSFIHAQALPTMMAGLLLNDMRSQLQRTGDGLFVAAVPSTVDRTSTKFPDSNQSVLPPMPQADPIISSRAINLMMSDSRRLVIPKARLAELPNQVFQVGLSGAFIDSSEVDWIDPAAFVGKLPEGSSLRQTFSQHFAANPDSISARSSLLSSEAFQKDLLATGLTFSEIYTLGRSIAFLDNHTAALPFYQAAIEQLKQQPNLDEVLQNSAALHQIEFIANVSLFVVKNNALAEQSLHLLIDHERPGTNASRRALFHFANMLERQGKKPDDTFIAKLIDAESRGGPDLETQEIQWVLGRSLFSLGRYEESSQILELLAQNNTTTYLTQPAFTLAIRASARAGKTETAKELFETWDTRFGALSPEAVSQDLQAEIAKPPTTETVRP